VPPQDRARGANRAMATRFRKHSLALLASGGDSVLQRDAFICRLLFRIKARVRRVALELTVPSKRTTEAISSAPYRSMPRSRSRACASAATKLVGIEKPCDGCLRPAGCTTGANCGAFRRWFSQPGASGIASECSSSLAIPTATTSPSTRQQYEDRICVRDLSAVRQMARDLLEKLFR
jgi:hypothetical protein